MAPYLPQMQTRIRVGVWLLQMTLVVMATTLFCHPSASAESRTASGADSRFAQRQTYKNAIGYLQSGQRSRFLKLKAELSGYPLEPYLTYFDLTRRISRQSIEDILTFADTYPDTPLADRLMHSWLYSRGRRGYWDQLVKYFDPSISTVRLDCLHAYALYKEGQQEAAFLKTTKLWLVDESQPDECDATFKVWRDHHRLTEELVWHRYSRSLQANNTPFAAYLVRFLTKEAKTLAGTYRQVHHRPTMLKQSRRFRVDSPHVRDIIQHGITRLARKDASLANSLWHRYTSSHDFSERQREETYRTIAINLSLQADDDVELGALPINLTDDVDLVEARIRQYLRLGDWNNALVFINALPLHEQQSSRWQYWKARILSQSADINDKISALDTYRTLAQTRGFYGFLSADVLHRPYSLVSESARLPWERIRELESLPSMQRALELFVLGEWTWARREWRHMSSALSPADLHVAAWIAQNWGWYKQAIQSLIDAEKWNDLKLRFPLAYFDDFIGSAHRADIPVNWSLAIARQESAFMPDAKSSAGALGIMQLMPNTARLTASSIRMRYRSRHDLTDPRKNITLGSAYLGQMLRRFDNNRIIATAAYNAGPSRVRVWLNTSSPFDVWVETIPFRETRNYVQNVLTFAVIYASHLDQEIPLILPHEREFFSQLQLSQTE